MWQQLDCSVKHATPKTPRAATPSCSPGSKSPWAPAPTASRSRQLQHRVLADRQDHRRRLDRAGLLQRAEGDAPYFKSLADNYAMSDNFHQSVNGGTGANHIMLGHGDAIWFSDGKGNAQDAAAQRDGRHRHANAGVVDEVENPNPAAGTNNWYTEDGYGGGSYGSAAPPTAAAPTATAPTRPARRRADREVPASRCRAPIDPRCEAGHYYLLNNYNPGYFGNGNNAYTDTNARQHRVHHSAVLDVPSIGDRPDRQEEHLLEVLRRPVEQLRSRSVPAELRRHRRRHDEYCNICNPFQYDTSIMANATSAPRTSRTPRTCTPTSRTARCPRSPSSSPAAWSTATRPPPSWICSKASPRRSSMRSRPIPTCGRTPPSSSPSTKAAATTTPATCSRSTSSATARASR
jgi:phospholipase C